MSTWLETKIHWWPTGDSERPWRVWYGQDELELEVIHVPGMPPHFTLYVSGCKQESFQEWPGNWTTEPESPEQAAIRADYEYELEKFKKNLDLDPIDEEKLLDEEDLKNP